MDKNTVIAQVTERFGSSVIKTYDPDGIASFVVASEAILPTLTFLKEQLGFTFLTDICGIQYLENELPFGVIYHMHNFKENVRVRLETFLTKEPTVQSATGLFPAANWMERETYDFFGIVFEGHPNLKRILNVEYLDYFPLRKEYPLEDPTRHDKEDRFFGR